MPSKPKPPAPDHDNETDCYELPQDSDIVQVVKEFVANCQSSRNFRAVQKDADTGTDILTIEITTPR